MDVQKLINQAVVHKSFGEGVICGADEKYLEVDFVNKKSKFAYPACFNGFLTLENMDIQLEMQAVVDAWRVESGAVEKEKIKRQYEKTIQGIEKRRIAAEKKKLLAAQKALEHRSSYNVRTEKKNSDEQ